ncbi:hypothetical protein SUGI_0539400 [Cryptomeria japonica]|nr:hypothetical protein SUGI_0539400 [Cryptomeria japonica]
MENFRFFKPQSSQFVIRERKAYDVFLSFRGTDLRKSLVDHLYQALSTAGLNVFLDSGKLERENIGMSLQQAIQNSSIYIPIFSPDYVSSAWCLREISLVWKMKSRGEHERPMIPLFYHVDPSDVRSAYAEAFDKHRTVGMHSPEEIQGWTHVLHEVSCLSGYSLEETSCGYEEELVKQVLKDVIHLLDVAKDPVGLAARTEELKLGDHTSDRLTLVNKTRYWNEALHIFENGGHDSVFKSLRISYDNLAPPEKHIFLDIACFFVNLKRSVCIQNKAFSVDFYERHWSSLGCESVYTCLKTLEEKGLIVLHKHRYSETIDEVDHEEDSIGQYLLQFSMHELIRDMGRRIDLEESEKDPAKRSRVWREEDIRTLVAAATIQLRRLDVSNNLLSEFPSSFQRLGSLVNLKMAKNEQLVEFPALPEGLITLNAKRCSKLQVIYFKNRMKSLKTMDLSQCEYLIQLGPLQWWESLRYLNLDGCKRLVRLDPLPRTVTCLCISSCLQLQKFSFAGNYCEGKIQGSIRSPMQSLCMIGCDIIRLDINLLLKELEYLEQLDMSVSSGKKLPGQTQPLEGEENLKLQRGNSPVAILFCFVFDCNKNVRLPELTVVMKFSGKGGNSQTFKLPSRMIEDNSGKNILRVCVCKGWSSTAIPFSEGGTISCSYSVQDQLSQLGSPVLLNQVEILLLCDKGPNSQMATQLLRGWKLMPEEKEEIREREETKKRILEQFRREIEERAKRISGDVRREIEERAQRKLEEAMRQIDDIAKTKLDGVSREIDEREKRKYEEARRTFEEARRQIEEIEKKKYEEARRQIEEREKRKFEEARRQIEEIEKKKYEEARRQIEEREKRKFEEARRQERNGR